MFCLLKKKTIYFLLRTRGMATGLAAASNYALGFISTKIYYNLETLLSLPGTALFNCVIIGLGLILMYLILPETENRTLEDIEMHFSDKSKKITHHKISKMSSKCASGESGFGASGTTTRTVSESESGKATNGFDNRAFIAEK